MKDHEGTAAVVGRVTGEWVEGTGVPGASVAVVEDGETVYASGFGNRRLDPPAPATGETVYAVASVTKPVTATAVLTLVERGDLALEDAVGEYVPYFEGAPGDPITVHDLLSHTSGMPDDSLGALLLDADDLPDAPTIEDEADLRAFVADTLDDRLLDRERCLYYNTGYTTLARIVEAVSGDSFPEYVQRAVFDPLGMDGATFDATVVADHGESVEDREDGNEADTASDADTPDEADVMAPYAFGEDGPEPDTLADNAVLAGAGGMLASAADLGRFVAASAAGGPHLGDDLRERAFDPVGTFRRTLDGTEHGYGYGWRTRPFGDDTLVGHDGGSGVSAAYVGFLRERGLGVAVAVNAHPPRSPAALGVALLAELTDRDLAAVDPETALDRKLGPLPGRYESPHGVLAADVEREGPRLVASFDDHFGERTVPLTPASLDPEDHRFEALEGDGTVTDAEFLVDADPVELLFAAKLLRRVGDVES